MHFIFVSHIFLTKNFIVGKIKSKLKHLIDYRDVYIMKRVTGRSWYARLTLQSEYKIGISKNTAYRNKRVNNAIKGEVIILSNRPVVFAKFHEDLLHALFSDSRFRMEGGRDGGLTEWFYLNFAEYLLLELWLFWYSIRPYVWFGSVLLFYLLQNYL